MAVNPERMVELWERIDSKLNELPERIARAIAGRKTGIPGDDPGDDPGDPDYDNAGPGGVKRDIHGRFSKVHETLEPIYSDQKQFDAKKEWWDSLGALTGVGAFKGIAQNMANQERFDRAKRAVWQSKQPPPIPQRPPAHLPKPHDLPFMEKYAWPPPLPTPGTTSTSQPTVPTVPPPPRPYTPPRASEFEMPVDDEAMRRFNETLAKNRGSPAPTPAPSPTSPEWWKGAAPTSSVGASSFPTQAKEEPLAEAEQDKVDEETVALTAAFKENTDAVKTLTEVVMESMKEGHKKFEQASKQESGATPETAVLAYQSNASG